MLGAPSCPSREGNLMEDTMNMKRKLITGIAGLAAALVVAVPAVGHPRDSNGDRLPDSWENRNNLSLNVNQAPKDQDQDGLRNMAEYKNHTDPRDTDTDGNGTDDHTQCTGHEGGEGHHGPPPPDGTTPPVAP
jgi:hypothetical protein